MTQASSSDSVDSPDGSIFGPRRLTQLLVLIAVGVCVVIFLIAGKWVDYPDEPYYRGSLLQPPMNVAALIGAIVLLCICALLGDLIVGRRWFLAGLFIATAALSTWSIRGGTMQAVLLRAQTTHAGRGIFLTLLLEHLILMAAIAGLWMLLWAKRAAAIASLPAAEEEAEQDEGRSTGSALLAQIGATLLILLIVLVETSVKKQALVGVFLAGAGGTSLAETFFSTRQTARWYWLAPLIAGVVGYLFAFFQPTGLEIGHLNGMFAGLARPLPLDYASLGCAGALLGYWANVEVVKVTGEVALS